VCVTVFFESFANSFAILLQSPLLQLSRLTGCKASAISALHSIVMHALFTNRTAANSFFNPEIAGQSSDESS
jgi:hypothetical protein